MGMSDIVVVKCPNCGNMVDFQSKAGDCSLETYEISSVPIKVAISLNNSYNECRECGELITLCCSIQKYVSMWVE